METPSSEELQFTMSRNSQAAKARLWIWAGLAVGLGLAGMRNGFGYSLLSGAIIIVVLFALVDRIFIRNGPKVGQVMITVGLHAIDSPRWTTKTKSFAWTDILEASAETTQAGRVLQLRLEPRPNRPDSRGFLNGVNPCRPAFPLSVLEAKDQERLLDAVNQRMREASGIAASRAAMENALTDERHFREKLEALAPRTWVTWGLVVVNVLIWVTTVAMGSGLTVGDPIKLFMWGGNSAAAVQQGEWWRLLTSAFLHSGVLHLVMNMAGLIAAGMTVERIYGHRLFVLIYLGSALAGSATSLHFSAQKAVSVGASGAVFGVAGALLVAVFHHRKSLPRLFGKQTLTGIGFFVAYSLFQGWATAGVDNGAHVGGLLAGAVLALILPERFDMDHYRRTVALREPLAALAIALATFSVAATAPRGATDFRAVHEATAALTRGIELFTEAWKALEQDVKDVKAGKLSELEADEKSRTVHAPRFRKVVQQFSDVKLAASDPRTPLAEDYRLISELMLESLAMDSRVVEGRPLPIDPVRSAQIEKELTRLGAKLVTDLEKLKMGQKAQRR